MRWMLIGPFVLWTHIACPVLGDDLDRRATWSMENADTVENQIVEWLVAQDLPEDDLKASLDIWQVKSEEGVGATTRDLLQRTIGSFAIAVPEVADMVRRCQSPASIGDLPDLELFDKEELDPVVRNNLRLYVGKWLAISGMYNECIDLLAPLAVEDAVAPEALLFYRSVAHYRLRNKDEGLESLSRLLENKGELPRRYVALAELMQAELDTLEPDTLNEIARIMDSVRVRLGLGRAGTRVRKEEDEVVEKLDKLIEELEKKRKQQQQQQAGNAGNRSNQPAQDSSLPGGQASPDVDPKRLAENAEWGDLPPKVREEALQSLGKEFPSHYREVIEEYFRKIARDEVETP